MSPVQTHRQTPDPDIPARARRASSARPGERGEEAGWWEGGAREGGDHKRCEAADPTHTPFTWLALVSEGRAGMERVAAPSSSLWRSWARARRLARRYPLRPRLWADDRVCWRAGGAASRQAHQRVCRRAACTRAARERGESLRSGDGRAGGRGWSWGRASRGLVPSTLPRRQVGCHSAQHASIGAWLRSRAMTRPGLEPGISGSGG